MRRALIGLALCVASVASAANNLTGDPLYIDAESATNVVVQGQRYVYAVCYSGGTTAGHIARLAVKSDTARVFVRFTATGNGAMGCVYPKMKTPGDLVADDVDSGVLLVYLGPER